jgi:hypothetical protein
VAAKGQSYAEKFSRWEVLVTNGKPGVADMPQMGADLTALEQMLGEVRSLESRKEDLRSQAQDLAKQIKAATQEGEKIRGRLGSTLKGRFGSESDALVKYGFKPRQLARRKKTDPSAPAPQPPGTPGAKTPGGTA